MPKKEKEVKNKGQFFIVAGLVGVIIIFSFVSVSIYKKYTKPEKFYDLSKNLKREAIEIIAKGKIKEYQGEEKMQSYLDNLTKKYLEYAIIEDPNVEIIWVYGNQSNITIFNFANQSVVPYGVEEEEAEVLGGRKEIESVISAEEIEYKRRSELADYLTSDIKGLIRKSFTPSNTNIKLQIGNYNYTFNLSQDEKFYLILRTRRENESLVHIEK